MKILFRPSYNFISCGEDEEFEAAKQFCDVYEYRTEIPENSLVVGRYSVLPYYKELENELKGKNCRLINSHEQHRYIADITNYYKDIAEYTPKTYIQWHNLPEGKWVVKGRTNSRKHKWDTHMFAGSTAEVREIASRLIDDTFIGDQGLVIREYIPLKTFDIGINGLPVTKEFRCFFYKEEMIGGDFYWSEHPDYYQEFPLEGKVFAEKVAKIVAKNTNFFVIDIAETESGEWIVIELNDGQMSGLSCNDQIVFYKRLNKILN